jgi:hypothetical protein
LVSLLVGMVPLTVAVVVSAERLELHHLRT